MMYLIRKASSDNTQYHVLIHHRYPPPHRRVVGAVGSNNRITLRSEHGIPVIGQYSPTFRMCDTMHL